MLDGSLDMAEGSGGQDAALVVAGLSHAWGRKPALEDLHFTLPAGRFCALLGPNGAGKSTLMAVLTGLIRPQPGVVRIGGHDMARAPRKALAGIGVVFQQPTLDLDLSVRANLRLFAALHGLAGREAARRIEAALEQLGMAERAGERVRALNGGHRRRMEIARALLHQPRLLLLDEPTVGLDAPARASLSAHVHDLVSQGISVLWATHLSDEIGAQDDVLLLSQGRIAAQGSRAEMAENAAFCTLFPATSPCAP